MSKHFFKILFLLLFTFCQTKYVLSQNDKIDSLLNVISLTTSDSLNAINYNNLAREYINKGKVDKAYVYSIKSLLISTENEDLLTNTESLLINAYISTYNNEPAYALKYYLRASNNVEKMADSLKIANVYNEIGLTYLNVDAYTKASEYFEKSYNISVYNNFSDLKFKSLKNLAYTNKNNENFTSALQNYSELALLYKNIGDTAQYINALTNLAFLYSTTNDYQKALETNKEIYFLLIAKNDIVNLSVVLNNVAYNCVYLKDFTNAILYFKQSLTISRQFGFKKDEADALTNLGICYQNSSDNKNAIDNLVKAEEIYTELEKWSEVAKVQNIIALIFYYSQDYYNAKIYSENSIFVAESNNEFKELQNCYETYSLILQKANDYENALNYYKKHLSIRDSLLVQERINEQDLAKGQYDAEKSEKELKLSMANEDMKDLALRQLKLESEKKEKELELLRRDKEVQELEKQRIEQSLILAQKQHEADVRDQEILTLEKEKELQEQEILLKEAQEKEQLQAIELLQTEKENQQLEIEKQTAEKKRMQHITALFAAIFIIILLSLYLVGKKNKQLKRQKVEIEHKNVDLAHKNEEIFAQKETLQQANEEIMVQKENLQMKNEEIMSINEELNVQKEEISEQKNLIEKKNKDITDSILYAKRIQNVIIPPLDALINNNIEHFVFFKPRDIVSGDFYWTKEIIDENNHKHIVATAADCTGHGVPGAFMSMLGISYLNEIVMQNKITEPHIILNKLREKVKQVLQQKGDINETKDGMDMALISYDIDTQILQYAGANNPLFHIRKYDSSTSLEDDKKNPLKRINGNIFKLSETRPDKMPVGVYIREIDSFAKHEISIQKDDTIYIFSDGFIDQFGGPEGRKFLAKYFKMTLLDCQDKSMTEQKAILEKTLNDWLFDKYEQLDDILVLGIKF